LQDACEFETGVNIVKARRDPTGLFNEALNFLIDQRYPNLPHNLVIDFARTGSISIEDVANYTVATVEPRLSSAEKNVLIGGEEGGVITVAENLYFGEVRL